MPNLYDGFYINLDRSPDRRAALEQQFATFGLADTYRRFPAVDGMTLSPPPGAAKLSAGERGIFRSHFDVLEAARASARPVHILEDDAILSPQTAPAIDLFIRAGILAQTDILFTETLVPQDLRVLKWFKSLYDAATEGGAFDLSKLQIIDLTPLKFACASSYVVNPQSIPKLLDRYRAGWQAAPMLPFDMFLREEANAGRLRASCSFPFVTSIDLAGIVNSTAGRDATVVLASDMVLAILRYSFFVGRNLEWAQLRLMEILAQSVDKRPDRHRVLIEKALGFILSDHFHEI